MTGLEWWKNAKKGAREAMGDLIKQTVDDTLEDMWRAKAYAKCHAETDKERALASAYFCTYVQAHNEVLVHEAMAESAMMKATQTPAKMA